MDPDDRVLYGASLRPPAGYVFDRAVATTYSLDLETALVAPVSLALFAPENRDEILNAPLALFEGVERISDRLLVFAEAGRIKANKKAHSRLCSLLEQVVVEVAAPGGGAFHPKIWALRYKPLPEHANVPVRIRVLVMSRNLTRDRSWDIALTLDGEVAEQVRENNRPLADLVLRLPELSTAGLPEGAGDLTEEVAEDLLRVEWELPLPFESVSFAVNGLDDGEQWFPEACDRLGVITPFCDGRTLSKLANLTRKEERWLIGHPYELARIDSETLERFDHLAVLDENAETEDGEDAQDGDEDGRVRGDGEEDGRVPRYDDEPGRDGQAGQDGEDVGEDGDVDAKVLRGLHAKVYVAEKGWNTSVTVGSGNATSPALLTGKNVEAFATLVGKRSKVGSIDEILGENGFGRLTRLFKPEELEVDEAEETGAKARRELDDARREICDMNLEICCERDMTAGDGDLRWRMLLVSPTEPLELRELESVRIWPITLGEINSRNALDPLRRGRTIDLGAVPLADLTRFLAFQLTHGNGKDSILFSTGLVIKGMPAERNDAILRQLIVDKDAFLRYLRLLLSEFGDPFSAAMAALESAGWGKWRNPVDDMPILEEMVRAFCRGDEQFEAIDRLIERLGRVGAFGVAPGQPGSNPTASTGQEPVPGVSHATAPADQESAPGVSRATAPAGQKHVPRVSNATASTGQEPVSGDSDAADPIPAAFRTLWRAFQEAYEERRSKHGR